MAGPYYVRSSDGNDGDDGLSWGNAKATLGGAVAVVAAGETIYVDDDHQETLTGDTAYGWPGTVGNLVRVIVVLTDTTIAVSNYDSAKQWIEGDTNNAHIDNQGGVCFWGIYLELGDGASGAHLSSGFTIFENSKIKMDAAVGDYFDLRDTGTTLILINSDIEFTNTVQYFFVRQTTLEWFGGTLTGDVNYLVYQSDNRAVVRIYGVDLSSIIDGTIINYASGAEGCIADIRGCKLNASPPTLLTGTIEQHSYLNSTLFDSGTAVYKFRKEYDYGYAMEETTLVVTGMGMYDGTNEYSVKLVSNAGATFEDPFRYHLATRRVDVNDTTITAYMLVNGNGGVSAALEDDEVWLEVHYPDNASIKYNIDSDRIATPTTTPAAQDADGGGAARWEGETNGRFQTLDVTIAAASATEGPVEFWICLAKPSTTIYICPEVVIS